MDIENARSNASMIEHEMENLHELCSQRKYKEFWARTKGILEMFQTLKPLSREDRERLWSSYSSVCETVRHEMEKDREEAKYNASKIEQEIDNLRYGHTDSNAPFLTTRYHYREFWHHAKEVSEMFKNLRLLREDRERLWSSYRSICDDVRSKQDDERRESERNREVVESLITDAYHQADGARDREALDQAKSMQTETLRRMKESGLRKEDREHCWQYWKEVNEKIHWKRHELQESNFLHIKEDASRCLNTAHYGEPYEALQEIKEVQGKLHGVYMNRDQRDEMHNTLTDAWDKATSRIAQIKEEKRRKHEEWVRRQEERKRKYEEWRERMEDNVQRWEGNIEKAEDYISSLAEQIDRLEDQAANARTDEYADRVRGWIEEKQQKIQDVRDQIREWECRIDDIRSKIGR